MIFTWNSALCAPREAQISLTKPGQIFDEVVAMGYRPVPAEPMTREDLYGVHASYYVDGVCDLQQKNGFGRCRPAERDHALAACGAMHKAAELALGTPGVPVLAPVSGFHHAHYASGYGFCTFNGLLATVAKLRQTRYLPNVLIIDGDAHVGDGTDEILERHRAYGPKFDGVVNLTNMGPDNWLKRVEAAFGYPWDLILYQAGADAHIADPFGAGYLDDDEWRARDELVFVAAAKAGIPIAWNLAGGYNGEKTIELHLSTARAALLGANIRRRLDLTPATILEPVQEAPTEPARPLTDDVGDEGRAPQG